MEDQMLWIVGEQSIGGAWKALSVCTSEQDAIDCCEFPSDFVAPLEAGVLLPRCLDEPNAWQGLYYPKRVEHIVDAAFVYTFEGQSPRPKGRSLESKDNELG